MITESCLTTVLPLVADSWGTLRGCDVYRLLDAIAYDNASSLTKAGEIITAKRPDLRHDVEDALADLQDEHQPLLGD